MIDKQGKQAKTKKEKLLAETKKTLKETVIEKKFKVPRRYNKRLALSNSDFNAMINE